VLDLIFGDPVWLYHPVRAMGLLIGRTEALVRRLFPKTDKGEEAAGIFLCLLVVSISTVLPWAILHLAGQLHPGLAFALCVFWDYQLLAAKSLRTESMKVYAALKEDNLEAARYAVSMIVGRDTEKLSAEGVAKAAVETVAENTSDGIIAPLLFLAIGGPVLGFFYKSINTLDSMVGYKNEKYLYLGRFSAKLDDVVNYIPARLSGIFMVLACAFTGLNLKKAWKIYRRDRKNHASPNSAHTEAAAAGALGIQLAGNAYYFGKLYEKPTIGDPDRPIEYEDIRRVNRLMYGTAVLALVCVTVIGLRIGV
jgi:adenosylcobinamide-phosphate synthase